jgi:5'-3' exonuclease
MGIKNLMKALQSLCPDTIVPVEDLSKYAGKTFAIEVSGFMYRFSYNRQEGEENAFLQCFIRQWEKLRSYDIDAIYVFDGVPIDIKREEIEKRKRQRSVLEESIKASEERLSKIQKTIQDEFSDRIILRARTTEPKEEEKNSKSEIGDTLEETKITNPDASSNSVTPEDEEQILQLKRDLQRKKRQLINVKPYHYDALRTLFRARNIPFVDADRDGERTCAILCKIGLADVCVTEDTDALPFGAPVILRNFDMHGKVPTEIQFDTVLDRLNMTYETFVDFCILCGCDYTRSIPGIAWVRSKYFLSKYKRIETFLDSSEGKKYRSKAERCDFSVARNEFTIDESTCEVFRNILSSGSTTLFHLEKKLHRLCAEKVPEETIEPEKFYLAEEITNQQETQLD